MVSTGRGVLPLEDLLRRQWANMVFQTGETPLDQPDHHRCCVLEHLPVLLPRPHEARTDRLHLDPYLQGLLGPSQHRPDRLHQPMRCEDRQNRRHPLHTTRLMRDLRRRMVWDRQAGHQWQDHLREHQASPFDYLQDFLPKRCHRHTCPPSIRKGSTRSCIPMSPSGFASSRISMPMMALEHRLLRRSMAYFCVKRSSIFHGSARPASCLVSGSLTACALHLRTTAKDTPTDAWIRSNMDNIQWRWPACSCQAPQRIIDYIVYHPCTILCTASRPWSTQSYLSACNAELHIPTPRALRGYRCYMLQRSPSHILDTAVPGPKPGRREIISRVSCCDTLIHHATSLDFIYHNKIAQEPRVGGSADQQPPVVHHMTTASVLHMGTKHNGQAANLGSSVWTAEAEATEDFILVLYIHRIHALYPPYTLTGSLLSCTLLPGTDLYTPCLGPPIFGSPAGVPFCLRSSSSQGQAVTAPRRNTICSLCPHLMCRSCPLRCLKLTISHRLLAPCLSDMLGRLNWLRSGPAGPMQTWCTPPHHISVHITLACRVLTASLRCHSQQAQHGQGSPIGLILCTPLSAPFPAPILYQSTPSLYTQSSNMGRNGPSPSAKLKSSRRPPSRFRNPTAGAEGAVGAAQPSAKATSATWNRPQASTGWGEAWMWNERDADWGDGWSTTTQATAGWWTGQWQNQWDGQQWTCRVPPPPPPPAKRRSVTSPEREAGQQEQTESKLATPGSSQDQAMPVLHSTSTGSAATGSVTPGSTLHTVKEELPNSDDESGESTGGTDPGAAAQPPITASGQHHVGLDQLPHSSTSAMETRGSHLATPALSPCG